ncbi:MAG: DUF2779 domain-containing protein, partial [Nitrospinaceae bacterium]|nr:DUF2779 domain-containing protein [Nitrospinaceae bacterium]NIR55337.1 DUF2779 domain-containing protein [Nitrospinaceae bacterium]NIS85776.1 DUF2779 domain-containing protein [Nitrospinaceae bacterium]NIT82626.1 DUF2779 domain-containing protein [Nitrospinaceae bacterium]NIU44831.1 DUF2779 domain-containing protein [Nitrospinaceae bacterium]
FESNGAWFRADILHRGKNGWELYEVKATTGIKPLHLEDVAFQFHVLEGCGLEVSQVCVVHLNPQYIRRGPLELGKLFQPVDCTREVRRKQDDLRNR